MSSRLREVEHIRVFDFEEEMVAGEKKEPFAYTHRKEYYFGNKNIYNSQLLKMGPNTLKKLKSNVNRMLKRGAFSYVDDDKRVEVVIRGGSTINYEGEKPKEFIKRIINE